MRALAVLVLLLTALAPLQTWAAEPAGVTDSPGGTSSASGTDSRGVSPSAQPLEHALEETNKALLKDFVRLAKFNIHFHLEANHHQWWRNYTYPIGREAGTALGFAGTLIDMRQQVRGLDNPRRISRTELKEAVRCAIVGNVISGAASAMELAQNTWVMLKARHDGYSPSASLSFVKAIVEHTDALLQTRDQLALQEASPEKRSIMQRETQLVRRIRQQLLFEYGTWSCHSVDQAWRENTFYTIDAAQNFTRMGAGIFAMRAFTQPRLARNAAILGLAANSAATINPLFRNFVGYTMRKHRKHQLQREIPFERPAEPSEPEEQQQLSTELKRDWLRNIATLSYRSDKIDSELDRELKEVVRYRQVAQQQSIAGPIIGLTGVASSTLATVAVYGHAQHPKTAIRMGLSGRISQGSGQVFALVQTPYTMIRGLRKRKKLREKGELPEQLLRARLKKLETY